MSDSVRYCRILSDKFLNRVINYHLEIYGYGSYKQISNQKRNCICNAYTDKNGYVTKRINLNARSHFADNENVVIISESDFEKYYQETASLDDFTENPMDEMESEIQQH